MTGEEKVQAVRKIIYEEYAKLIRKKPFKVSSDLLEEAGIELHEQTEALDVLADNLSCITYTSNRTLADKEKHQAEIYKSTSVGDLLAYHIIQNALSQIEYTITVLIEEEKDAALTKYSHIGTTQIAKLSINKASKTLRLTYRGVGKDLKKFKSTRNINYIFLNNLLNRPGETLDRKALGVAKCSTRVKDLPKSAGISNDLKNIFFDTDSKAQTLTLCQKKSLSTHESEILEALVNRH